MNYTTKESTGKQGEAFLYKIIPVSRQKRNERIRTPSFCNIQLMDGRTKYQQLLKLQKEGTVTLSDSYKASLHPLDSKIKPSLINPLEPAANLPEIKKTGKQHMFNCIMSVQPNLDYDDHNLDTA